MAIKLPAVDGSKTAEVEVKYGSETFKLIVSRFSVRERTAFEALSQAMYASDAIEAANANAELKQSLLNRVIGWLDVLDGKDEPVKFTPEAFNQWIIADSKAFWAVTNSLDKYFSQMPSTAESDGDRDSKKPESNSSQG